MAARQLAALWLLCGTAALCGAQEPRRLALTDPCTLRHTCSECLQTPACAWCAQPDFVTASNASVQRCSREQAFHSGELSCAAEYLSTWANQVTVLRHQPLSSALPATTAADAIQIAPQHVRLSLRVSEPQPVAVQFALAPNYPIDLYYLMDLSKSMEDDKDKLSTLGNLLAQEMRQLTSNFRLGFGSFVDKVVMPYVSTVPKKLLEPCDSCIPPYGYQNQMALTADTAAFETKVSSAKVSGNLDAPEGGFDAIMQAIVCKEEISWRSNARRLLVFSTDAGFHYAGDGKLGGVVKPHDGLCHLDAAGSYTHSELLDYPSVSHINQKVKENSINLIFAVTAEQRETYDELSRHIEASSAGTLSNDSSNVVQLVKEQYAAITSFVEMKDNSSEFVRIRYYSSCLGGGPPEERSRCDGLRIGQQVNFTASVELLKCPEDPERWHDFIEIRPAGLKESLLLEIAMQCQCDCEVPSHPSYVPSAAACSGQGDLRCGICSCHGRRFGAVCECSESEHTGRSGEQRCRPDNSTGPVCSARGECVCGQCQCFQRPSAQEVVTGDFCECDNFSCDRHEKLLCSGADHGSCVCGQCVCRTEWTGDACQCPASNATCIAPGDTQPCSGNGQCECGRCRCSEGASGRYSGQYCADCPTCKGKCDEYRPCVECTVFASGELLDTCQTSCAQLLINQTDVVEVESPDERMCIYTDESVCRYRFVYGYDGLGSPVIRVQPTKQCPAPINVLSIVLTLIAAIVAVGMATLLLWKLLTTIHDRREYAKWDSERKNAKWDTGENPIYKQATSTFKNPAYGGKM